MKWCIHCFSMYAPQTSCPQSDKEYFRKLLEEKSITIPGKDLIIVGDLNSHIGAWVDGFGCHGRHGFETRNKGVLGAVQPITFNEVAMAMKQMKTGKGTGSDGVVIELWKLPHWNPCKWLMELFNQIVLEKILDDWQCSTTLRFSSPGGSWNNRNILSLVLMPKRAGGTREGGTQEEMALQLAIGGGGSFQASLSREEQREGGIWCNQPPHQDQVPAQDLMLLNEEHVLNLVLKGFLGGGGRDGGGFRSASFFRLPRSFSSQLVAVLPSALQTFSMDIHGSWLAQLFVLGLWFNSLILIGLSGAKQGIVCNESFMLQNLPVCGKSFEEMMYKVDTKKWCNLTEFIL
ncbi:hypothetical protein JRQ81_019019 [Phrynocephalus forsythii]|uniref:Endonuclease/exonuclease/phosphatase domain-containing protein n=1 Tax=Phrynocephalus forsythii TaxID=171643 RepID=A0A9Q0XPN3_9SAUR|nr:hypothetical protein JRQ81_019019 [Phrynocephalus forsythii]